MSEWRDTREWHARRASDAAATAIRQGYRDGEDTAYITTPPTGAADSAHSRDSMT